MTTLSGSLAIILPSGPSLGLFPAAPASRRRVACHLSRTSSPSVRAAGTPPPPCAAGSRTVTPSANPPRGCGCPRHPVLGPLSVLPPPSPGIVLPPLSRGPRCGMCVGGPHSSGVTLKPLLSGCCHPRRCPRCSIKAALTARPCPPVAPASGRALCVQRRDIG